MEEFKFYLEEDNIGKVTFAARKMIFLNRSERRLLFHREESLRFKLMVFDYYRYAIFYYRHTVASSTYTKIKYKDYRLKYISYTF